MQSQHILESQLPTVSVIICSRNEPFDVCKMTIDSAFNLDYPEDKIEYIVVDNSGNHHTDLTKWRQYVDKAQPSLNALFVHREGAGGYKAKNMQIGIDRMQHELA
ncbi:MAG: glycosyltransferase family 2 protein [Cellvibrionales bacterium]|nr:glycosyltransferase family 2 protein [Cellvibrionales bacterium]